MAGNNNYFNVLSRGVHFDTKRFQTEMQQFHTQHESNIITQPTKAQLNALDFFGYDNINTNKKNENVQITKKDTDNTQTIQSQETVASKSNRKRKRGLNSQEKNVLTQDKQVEIKTVKSKRQLRREKTKNQANTNSKDATVLTSLNEVNSIDDDTVSLFHDTNVKLNEETAISQNKSKINEEIQTFRRQMKIKVNGTVVPNLVIEFKQMQCRNTAIKKSILGKIEASEYKEPTPIQMQAIPSILARRDVLAIAPTGSGKTAAFAIPILCMINPREHHIQAIILAPTRELTVQIEQEFNRLNPRKSEIAVFLLSKANAATLYARTRATILIATPLRLVHILQESTQTKEKQLDLSCVKTVCFDEADRLLEMGFVEQVDVILAACTNASIQRLLFSATILQNVEEIAQSILRDPIHIQIGVANSGNGAIDQKLLFVGKEQGKLLAIKQLIKDGLKVPALVFVQNKTRATELYHELLYEGIHVGAIHTDRTKEQRDITIQDFRCGKVWVLICTDLMSRGMDFKAVKMVINYDFPQSAVSYIHRIGRTGRNGREGHAVTFFTENDMVYLRSIANVMKLSGCDVPAWMLSMKKASVSRRKEMEKRPPKRHRIKTVSGYDLKKQHHRKQITTNTTKQDIAEPK